MLKNKNRIWTYPLIVMGALLILTSNCKKDKTIINITVTDIDGNIYDTIHIGTQVWLKQNLKATHYTNGDAIANVTDSMAWSNLTTGAYCDYYNTPGNSSTYGNLYNFYALVESRNLCPKGWHVPTNTEWSTLVTYLGGRSVAGGKLKETGTIHWNTPNYGATNETGFTALSGGGRSFLVGSFVNFGEIGYWWSSSEADIYSAWGRKMTSFDIKVYTNGYVKSDGFSVRCIKD
jgi:uncharacterized protein (TIGR02145 family)